MLATYISCYFPIYTLECVCQDPLNYLLGFLTRVVLNIHDRLGRTNIAKKLNLHTYENKMSLYSLGSDMISHQFYKFPSYRLCMPFFKIYIPGFNFGDPVVSCTVLNFKLFILLLIHRKVFYFSTLPF